MSAKQGAFDQHAVLHERWPGDCCLCRTERQRDEARGIARAALTADWTLRDLFAGFALAGLVWERSLMSNLAYAEDTARAAYMLADAMLRTREAAEGRDPPGEGV